MCCCFSVDQWWWWWAKPNQKDYDCMFGFKWSNQSKKKDVDYSFGREFSFFLWILSHFSNDDQAMNGKVVDSHQFLESFICWCVSKCDSSCEKVKIH